MNSNDIDMVLLSGLLDVARGVHNTRAGLCGNLEHALSKYGRAADRGTREVAPKFGEAVLRFQALLKTWPKYSGSPGYPIPCARDSTDSPKSMYNTARRNGTLWDRRTEYGRLRWELLNFLIDYLNIAEASNA